MNLVRLQTIPLYFNSVLTKNVLLQLRETGLYSQNKKRRESNGSHGESVSPDESEIGLMRVHWIIGPPFVNLNFGV